MEWGTAARWSHSLGVAAGAQTLAQRDVVAPLGGRLRSRGRRRLRRHRLVAAHRRLVRGQAGGVAHWRHRRRRRRRIVNSFYANSEQRKKDGVYSGADSTDMIARLIKQMNNLSTHVQTLRQQGNLWINWLSKQERLKDQLSPSLSLCSFNAALL